MTQSDTGPNSASSSEALNRLLDSHHIKLGERHRSHLDWLVTRFGHPAIWSGADSVTSGSRLIIVVEPPTGPQVDQLFRSLHSACAVVVPFGENPAFDFLKSKLKDFGTIGSSGFDGPHELWWGGLHWSSMPDGKREQLPLIVSCYPRAAGDDAVSGLRQSLTALDLDFLIEAIDTASLESMHGHEKTKFILRIWETSSRPILWVEPDSVFVVPPSLLTKLNCDFAVHKWNRCEMSARTLYFGRSDAAETLLRTWNDFATGYPAVWEGYALDQAWSLISSQLPINTIWLPRSYHEASGGRGRRSNPVIIHRVDATTSDLGPDQGFPKALRAARRAGRTGAPEALVAVKSNDGLRGAVTVILRDIQSADARAVATTIDTIVAAFKKDSGGFGQLELSLCLWREDVSAATAVATNARNRILNVTPAEKLSSNLFRRFAESANVLPFSAG